MKLDEETGRRAEAEVLLLVSKTSESVAPGKIDRRSKYRAERRERGREEVASGEG